MTRGASWNRWVATNIHLDHEKISPKRKRGRDDVGQEAPERSIKWKVGLDLKDKALQAASTLIYFIGVNIVSFHEVTGALDATKSKINELDVTLENIKEAMASEYTK
jgi:hypothetical protein